MSELLPGFHLFSLLTTVLGIAAAFVSGRAIAGAWNPRWFVVLVSVPLALAARLLDLMLVGQALTVTYLLVSCLVLGAFAFAGFTLRRSGQMRRQYPWLAG